MKKWYKMRHTNPIVMHLNCFEIELRFNIISETARTRVRDIQNKRRENIHTQRCNKFYSAHYKSYTLDTFLVHSEVTNDKFRFTKRKKRTIYSLTHISNTNIQIICFLSSDLKALSPRFTKAKWQRRECE